MLKMKLFHVLTIITLGFAQGELKRRLEEMSPCTKEYIDLINSKQNSWIAGENTLEDEDNIFLNQSLLPDVLTERLPERKAVYYNISLPTHFDAREHWPNCVTIREIRDQSRCEGCWAFAPVEVMSDRICIHSDNQEQNEVRISPQQLIECCENCFPTDSIYKGCLPGYPTKAWNYWYKFGLVTGGDYNDTKTCLPFFWPPCDWSLGTCKMYVVSTCKKECQKGYEKHFEDDIYYGGEPYSVSNCQEDIMAEILINGPVQTVFKICRDFSCYKSGVYRAVDKSCDYHHAVKIIGWGETKDKLKIPYWLVANSKGIKFGDSGGFLKFLRGSNECGIESCVHAAIPKPKSKKRISVFKLKSR